MTPLVLVQRFNLNREIEIWFHGTNKWGCVHTPYDKPFLPFILCPQFRGHHNWTKKGAGQTSGNIINDSVPILTHLEQGIYTDFISSVKEAIDVEVAEDAPTPFEYCVRNPTNMNFPEFVLHFTGADVVLNPNNMFIALDNNLVCMAVDPPKEFPSLEIGHSY
ncbi:putative aspartic protease [Glycine max]|nr:putative aspartic protease [Glycine max]